LFFAPAAQADVRTEARRHFRQGMALIAEGDVDAGIRSLEQAYTILPHPNVLYNIGRAYAESGRYAEAVGYFERYLESDPPDRAEVLGFLEALRARLEAMSERTTAEARPAEAAAPATAEPTAAPIASDEEIEALEESATQIETLAESSQSDALRARAQQLRELAATLREQRAAPVQAAAEPSEGGQPAESGEGEGDGDSALVLGEQREGDTYEETVVSSSRAAQSPLEAPNSTTLVTAQDLRLSGFNQPGEALRRVA